MTARWIKMANIGEPVWIGDVREELNEYERQCTERGEKCQLLTVTIKTANGRAHNFRFPLPEWESTAERDFILDYLTASLYNLLSALGASEMVFDFDGDSTQLSCLISELQDALLPDAAGYGRITREIRRIDRLIGSSDEYSLKEENRRIAGERLSEWLKRVSGNALSGVRAGIDVGGTDIKCVASVNGELRAYLEYDWNPLAFTSGEQLTSPIAELAKRLLKKTGADRFDGIGLSFPDVALRNRICGGETPKTVGIRECEGADYEKEFLKLFNINETLQALCAPEGRVRIINDGFAAAFISAVELAYCENREAVEAGIFSHALGTSLGSGWIDENGDFPEIPLEFYDSIIDLGNLPSRGFCRDDLRSTLSPEGVHTGVDRYVGQASAFRYAYNISPALLNGFITETDGIVSVSVSPRDMRKSCLEHLMRLAENGDGSAERVFFNIGHAFAQVSREVIFALNPKTSERYIYGRFVKYEKVFSLLAEGFHSVLPEVALIPADSELACSPLMKQLASMREITVAQFAQAVGAVYLSEF